MRWSLRGLHKVLATDLTEEQRSVATKLVEVGERSLVRLTGMVEEAREAGTLNDLDLDLVESANEGVSAQMVEELGDDLSRHSRFLDSLIAEDQLLRLDEENELRHLLADGLRAIEVEQIVLPEDSPEVELLQAIVGFANGAIGREDLDWAWFTYDSEKA